MTVTAPRVLRPSTPSELARALLEADEAGLAVVPRGAGSRQYVGNPPSRADLILETGALADIVDYTPADLTVTVGAGMRLSDLQRELGRAGQRLPLDPPHRDVATIGGLIATDSSGPRRARHGTLRDLVIGTRVALVDGTIARSGGRVVKNVAGYDLNKLYIGSLGTLGIVVEATLKVLPLPEREEAMVATFASLREAIEAALDIARTPLRPSALEAHELEAAPTLLVVAEGESAPVARVLDDATKAARAHAARTVERADSVEPLLDVTRSLPQSERGALLRASVPLAAQPALAQELRRIARDRSVHLGIAAHAASGVVRARLRGERDAVREAALEAAAGAKSLEGDAWLERIDEGLRKYIPDVWYGEPPGFFLMRRIKREFDPKGTLNPGRFVGGI